VPLKEGQPLELLVEKGVYRGLGLARHEGQVVFVPRAFPGDRLLGRVSRVERGFVRAAAEQLLEEAPGRRPAPCPHAEACGGCAYQELGYEEQLTLKSAILAETLRRAGVPVESAIDVAPSPETGWRSRAAFHFETRSGSLLLGLHEEGTHRVVDLERCPQLAPEMWAAVVGLRDALRARSELWPRISNLEIAAGSQAGLVATLATTLSAAEATALVTLRSAAPGLTGLAAITQERGKPVLVVLHGSPWLGHEVLGLPLRSHAQSFFQANRHLVDALVRFVLDVVPAEGPVLDLYAGVGLFSLPLAQRGRAVRAVEGVPQAADDARENAKRLGLSSFRMEAADVRRALADRPQERDETVVLDPPRSGAGLDVVELVAARRPRAIVYVSCDPPTLGRDLAHFAKQGYTLDALRAFDMFPDTFHVEAVARLLPAAHR
jgi:23S rRNA (uracil1939-C5)-methyltransferase